MNKQSAYEKGAENLKEKIKKAGGTVVIAGCTPTNDNGNLQVFLTSTGYYPQIVQMLTVFIKQYSDSPYEMLKDIATELTELTDMLEEKKPVFFADQNSKLSHYLEIVESGDDTFRRFFKECTRNYKQSKATETSEYIEIHFRCARNIEISWFSNEPSALYFYVEEVIGHYSNKTTKIYPSDGLDDLIGQNNHIPSNDEEE